MMTLCKTYRGRSSYGERIHILGDYNPLLSAQIRKVGAVLVGVAELLLRSSARASDYTRRGIAINYNTAASVDWIVVEIVYEL